jgi:hypothetical protein
MAMPVDTLSLVQQQRQYLRAGNKRKVAADTDAFGNDAVTAGNSPLIVAPDFFRSFDEGESTYEADADFGRGGNVNSPQLQFQEGWVPDVLSPPGSSSGVVGTNPAFFHESMSGGPGAAWQTHYPPVVGGLSKASSPVSGPWFRSRAGSWGQGYVATVGVQQSYGTETDSPALVAATSGDLPPDWFDNNVLQHDAFGRKRFPSMMSPRRLVGWKERAVNTSLTCALPGCTGNASIQMFNPYTERARSCLFSFFVHPTDFDQSYSGEQVAWITVNNVTVKTTCEPQVSGCRAPVSKQLHACVTDLPLDKIITQTGLLEIRAKISAVVDECPYNGSLLAAVPTATCMVAPQDQSPVPMMSPNQPNPLLGISGNQTTRVMTAPLKCRQRGCLAYFVFQNYLYGANYTSCTMKVTVNQTDFDNSYNGTPEGIEYIAVQGVNVTTGFVSPGKNPCTAVAAGTPLPQNQLEYVVVQNVPVTKEMNSGLFTVDGKVSPGVDECSSNGYLFDGMIEIVCQI